MLTMTTNKDSSKYEQHWKEVWTTFNRALKSPDDFSAVTWLLRLAQAAFGFLYYKSGLYRLGLHRVWRCALPGFAIFLVSAVIMSFTFHFRPIIRSRWCCQGDHCDDIFCIWPILHDMFTFYIGVMIVFNYLSACFRSPGVALAATYDELDDRSVVPDHLKWSSVDSNGGCCCWNPMLQVQTERRRVSMYQHPKSTNGQGDRVFPSLEWSSCIKCGIMRPPRCHHCSVCDRCVLEFDHHCIWLNNCIGQNNYRPFFLTLLYLTIGCLYGALIIFVPFCEPLKRQVSEKGWHIFYENSTGFLNLPPPGSMLQQFFTTGLDRDSVVKLVFPFLFGVGLLQAIFLGHHIRYVLAARTTLEHKILLDRQYEALVARKEVYQVPPNPFDHGPMENLTKTLGPNLLLILLPIAVDTNFVDKTFNKKSR